MRLVTLFVFLILFCSPNLTFGGKLNSQETLYEQEVKELLVEAEKFIPNNLDSALYKSLEAKKLISKVVSIDLKIKIYNGLGEVYKLKGELDKALNCYLISTKMVNKELLFRPNNKDILILKSTIHLKLGSLYLQLFKLDKSLYYYNKSLEIVEKIQDKLPKEDLAVRKLKLFNNIAAVYMQKEDYETALVYLRNSLESNEIVQNQLIEGTLLNNIGICYLEKKQNDLASHNFQKALLIRKKLRDKKGQAQVLNNIGKNEVYQSNFLVASSYFKEALVISSQIGNNESALISLQSLALVYDTLGQYKEALNYYKRYKELNDKLYSFESKYAISNLEVEFKREKEKSKYELKLQRKEAESLRSKIKNIIIISILFFLLIFAIFFIISMRNRIKNDKLKEDKLKLEQEKLALEHQTLQEDLEFKEKELTSKALYLLKNNELISTITDKLIVAKKQLNSDKQYVIQEIISELKLSQNNNLWQEFEVHFTKVHSQFYDSLQAKFPSLTSNEKKLCAFLRLNLSTKDISDITRQSVNSITVARSRLRKKLNIEGEDIQLINFLMSI